eukprot:TRINITY_DN8038_c0_g1_i5.p2 TRINITY_DN8038_c0_g1~~TRINITY_DN8038_c0_g1_i5.p2  ORF type:complete len:150 (-),score=24.15 TRINITY_DN8038_c0_g1_i5:215-664(-)
MASKTVNQKFNSKVYVFAHSLPLTALYVIVLITLSGCFNRVPSYGFAIWTQKRKLLPQYVGVPGEVLAKLRAGGTEINEVTESLEIVYSGDTTLKFVHDHPHVLAARVLIMEMTFVCEKMTVQDAVQRGHIHLDEVCFNIAVNHHRSGF